MALPSASRCRATSPGERSQPESSGLGSRVSTVESAAPRFLRGRAPDPQVGQIDDGAAHGFPILRASRCMLKAVRTDGGLTLRRAVGVALVVAALGGCASAKLTISNATPGKPLNIPVTEYRPKGDGPFPAVVLL